MINTYKFVPCDINIEVAHAKNAEKMTQGTSLRDPAFRRAGLLHLCGKMVSRVPHLAYCQNPGSPFNDSPCPSGVCAWKG